MTNYLPLFIGFRYLLSKRSDGFVSFVSVFSFLAMALGVMTLITVLSVMNGFDHEIKMRILQIIPHATIEVADNSEGVSAVTDWQSVERDLSRLANVNAVVPYVSGQAMVSYGGRMQGVSMHGIRPEQGAIGDSLGRHLVSGRLQDLRAGHYNIVIGNLLANALGVGVGDRLLLTLPDIFVTPVGVYPRVKKLTIAGVFEAGAQVDGSMVFMHMADAAKLLRMGSNVTGLRLFLDDPFNFESLAVVKQSVPKDYQLTTWYDSMSQLFAAIRMEKTVVGLLLSVIIGVAAFNIVASLVLMVNEKRTDIAVLRTLGSSSADISRIFQIQGGLTGLAGVILGVVVGSVLALSIGDLLVFIENTVGFSLFDPDLYFITRLPSQLQWPDVVVVATLGILVSILASWYPALRAGRVPPADALRYT
ncbi:MAG: lipoprotein-releasing ABC transporter permease subunit [Gammaproteobacteria bacterium]|nr:MAG: lipoprotein-releasing ABC transporter permease subunit [Gammaproteobacteria bacterium]RLA53660.1 MAG: lipoprotein-releasing ABC transporter permease subunit [Gammaproteobacteria bacterium]